MSRARRCLSVSDAVLLTAMLALSALMTAPMTAQADDDNAPRTIALSASGRVEARPDQAIVSIGVVTEGDTAAEALDANNGAMRNLVDGLKAAGVGADDLQTRQFSIQPRYTRSKRAASSSQSGSAPQIDGYEARNGLRVRVREIKDLGKILDDATELGANNFDGIEFVVSDAETRRDEARRKAVTTARQRAELYAEAAGVKLKEILTITENGGSPRPHSGMVASARMESVPVEAGTMAITSQVQIVWRIE
ncbi:MAG: SIMPL domain-containing protein [Pseudomonadota bacterium]